MVSRTARAVSRSISIDCPPSWTCSVSGPGSGCRWSGSAIGCLLETARGAAALRDLAFLAVDDAAIRGDLVAEAEREFRAHPAVLDRPIQTFQRLFHQFAAEQPLRVQQPCRSLARLDQLQRARLELDAHRPIRRWSADMKSRMSSSSACHFVGKPMFRDDEIQWPPCRVTLPTPIRCWSVLRLSDAFAGPRIMPTTLPRVSPRSSEASWGSCPA